MASPLKIGVLLSGHGTTLQNLLDRIADGRLDAEIVIVGSNRADAQGLQRARRVGLPVFSVSKKNCSSPAEFGNLLLNPMREAGVELVCLAGFMQFLPIPADFTNRVMNMHPSLIPAFCGKGFYGHHVHDAVLAYGVKVSGCTVHFVDNDYDHGPIILQKTVEVLATDTSESLAKRVSEQECIAYPEAISLFGAKRLLVLGRTVAVR